LCTVPLLPDLAFGFASLFEVERVFYGNGDLTAALFEQFGVDSIGWAILGSLVVTLTSWFVGAFGPKRELPLHPGA